jgi:hypothetical protein
MLAKNRNSKLDPNSLGDALTGERKKEKKPQRPFFVTH